MILNGFFFNFYFILLISVLSGISCSNRFSVWVFLELNMLSFTILLCRLRRKKKLGIQYFIVQRVGSSIFLFACCFSNIVETRLGNSLIELRMFLKLGVFPFFQWYLEILENCDWSRFFLLSSIQKILPLFLLSRVTSRFYVFVGILRVIIGAIFRVGETRVKKILGYSRLFNGGWFLTTHFRVSVIGVYIFCYMVSSFRVIVLLFSSRRYLNFHALGRGAGLRVKICLIAGILSIAGFPPFLGFWGKLIVLNFLLTLNMVFSFFVLVVMSFLIIFVYLIICASGFNAVNLYKGLIKNERIFWSWVVIVTSAWLPWFLLGSYMRRVLFSEVLI